MCILKYRKIRTGGSWRAWGHRFESCTIHHKAEPKKISARKAQKFQLFRPIGTQCVMGVQSVRAKARRKLMHLSLRLAFYIRIELDRSNVDGRSFQAYPDKMLCFQGMFRFRRKRPSFLNFWGTIENTGQTGFFGFTGDSSQIVVMQLPVAGKLFQEWITWCAASTKHEKWSAYSCRG